MGKKVIMEYEDDKDFHEIVNGLTEQVKISGIPMAIFKTPDGNVLVKIPKEIKK